MRKIFIPLFIVFSAYCEANSSIGYTVYFDSGSSEVHVKGKQWIDSVSAILRSATSYSVSIKGYCDSDGSEESNLLLARARSENILEIFQHNKLERSVIDIKSFGEEDPVAENVTESGKRKNRRVEIAITYQLTESINDIKNEDDHSDKENSVIGNVISSNSFSSEKLEVGKTLILKNMNFEGGTPVMLPESEPVLKELLKLMKDNPTLEIEIGGHVCCGPDYELSLLRARKVYTYLVGFGIDPKRMIYKGYSFNKSIADERTEEGRIKNRRVEITILKM